jgi:hypothetical protein
MAELTFMNRRAAARELSASIAHEVNQPLTGIATRARAALRWLRGEKPDLEKVGACPEQILAASHRAADIVTSVRAMFRKDRSESLPVDVNNLVRTVLSILRIDLQRNGMELEIQLDEQLPAVQGDNPGKAANLKPIKPVAHGLLVIVGAYVLATPSSSNRVPPASSTVLTLRHAGLQARAMSGKRLPIVNGNELVNSSQGFNRGVVLLLFIPVLSHKPKHHGRWNRNWDFR